MTQRIGNPAPGWQWMRVKFENSLDSNKSVIDWFALNTGTKE